MSSQWKEAMRSSKAIPGRLGTQVPPYNDMLLAYLRLLHQVLETPMRMLIRKYPDLAELVLDQCYKEKKNLGEGVFVDMTFEFIEDSFNYRYRWILMEQIIFEDRILSFAGLSKETNHRGFLVALG